jgi:hypothetical protein
VSLGGAEISRSPEAPHIADSSAVPSSLKLRAALTRFSETRQHSRMPPTGIDRLSAFWSQPQVCKSYKRRALHLHCRFWHLPHQRNPSVGCLNSFQTMLESLKSAVCRAWAGFVNLVPAPKI